MSAYRLWMGELSIIWLSEECSGAKIALVSTHISLGYMACANTLYFTNKGR